MCTARVLMVSAGFTPWRARTYQVRPHINSSSDQVLQIYLSHTFSASRGLSQRVIMKWEERETSAGFRRVSYHACPLVSLTTSDVFVTCDTTQRTGLNLRASTSGRWIWARAQILNGPIRVEDGSTLWAAVVVDPITSLWGKPKTQILRQIFRSLRVFWPVKHTYVEWNLLGFMELLVFLWFGTFLFEEKAICGVTSGRRWMEWFRGLSRQGKHERFAVARRETRKHIASFKETKYDFSL